MMKQFFTTYKNECLLAIVISSLYFLTAYNVTVTNDSCSNIEQINRFDMLSRSSHFGFHFLAVLFHFLFSIAGISSAIFSTEAMLLLLSVAGSIALFRLVMHWWNDAAMGVVVVMIYAFASNIWRFSVQCEYHIMVPSLCLIALLLFEKQKPVLAGLVFAFSVLTSFFSFWMLPMAFIRPFVKEKKYLYKSLAGFISLYLAVSAFTASQTFGGDWSYQWVFEYNKNTAAYVEPVKVIASCLYGYFRSFHLMLPVFLFGAFHLWKHHRRLFALVLCSLLMHLPAAIPENRYGGYQMTFYPLFAITCALVFFGKDNRLRILPASLLLLSFMATSAFVVLSERGFQHLLSRTYTAMQEDARIPNGSVVLMYQATKPLQTVYAPRLKAVSIFTSQQEVLNSRLVRYNAPDYNGLVQENASIFMLESGTSQPDDYLKVFFSSFLKSHGVKTKGFGAEKIKKLYPGARMQPLSGYEPQVYAIVMP